MVGSLKRQQNWQTFSKTDQEKKRKDYKLPKPGI